MKQVVILLLFLFQNRHSVWAISRAYPKGCSHEPPEFYDYDQLEFPPPNLTARSHDDFALLRRLGAGKFSDVFEAIEVGNDDLDKISTSQDDIDPSSLCVIKCLKPVSERKIKRELLVLSHASKLPNLARLRAVVVPSLNSSDTYRNNKIRQQSQKKSKLTNSNQQNDGKMPSLVLEHAGTNARWLCHGLGCDPTSLSTLQKSRLQQQDEPYYLTEFEIKYYLCHLLVALDALHASGIMHRDIKPRNVLINRQWPPRPRFGAIHPNASVLDAPPLMLIDLGLADFYLPNQQYNVRVASRHYKAPELLTGNVLYDYGIDMWSVGCILAGLLLRKEPLFRGKDNVDQLGKIVSVLGSQDLLKYVEKYGLEINSELKAVIRKYTMRTNPTGHRKPWLSLLAANNKNEVGNKVQQDKARNSMDVLPSQEGLNLLDQLLVYDHELRLTAREAMMHPFFDDVREIIGIEVQKRWASERSLAPRNGY
mmetsp:Transcript_8325/g.11816  ORF Transcript_8325/g.11816 Transcript_8325/m.11816 type:complete len:480 (-) Transcript_8325:133-1572(-)